MAYGLAERQAAEIATEAAEARTRIEEIDPNFVADPNASFQTNFIEALGFEEAAFGNAWGAFDADVINSRTDLLEQLDRVSPEAFLDAVATANPAISETVELVKASPELAEALHSAVVNDPTVLTGLEEMLSAEGEEAVADREALHAALRDPQKRGYLTSALENVATDPDGTDINFTHIEALMDAEGPIEQMAALQGAGVNFNPLGGGAQGWQGMVRMLQNPEGFIQSFVSSIEGLPPEFQNMLAGLMDGLSRMMGGFLDLNGEFVGHYYRGFSDIGGQLAQYGEGIMNFETPTGTETRTSGLDGVISKDAFDDVRIPPADQAAATADPANVDPANSPNEPASREIAQVVPPSQAGGLAGPG